MSRVVLIAVGEELLTGTVVNTHSAFLSHELLSLDLEVRAHWTVGDGKDEILQAVRQALQEFDIAILTGGLGPTEDDRTREAVAAALDLPLELDPESLGRIRAMFEALGREMTPNNEKQAYFPKGSEILLNKRGTAPGFWIQIQGKAVCCLPGVPRELVPMVHDQVKPRLLKYYPPLRKRRLLAFRTFGLAEAKVDTLLKGVKGRFPFAQWGLRAHYPETHVRFLVEASNEEEIRRRVSEIEEGVRELLGDSLFGKEDETMEQVVGILLERSGLRLAVAESCTGGLVGDRITNVSGSSRYFERGVVVYSNEAKAELLGVPKGLIERHGAVSSEVAQAMAKGVLARSHADLGLAVTGIAGPTGGTEEKPVGTVHIALADKDGIDEKRYRLRGTREQIKLMSSTIALDTVRRYLLHRHPERSEGSRGAERGGDASG